MPDLTLEIFEQAQERAKTDEPLARGIQILERLNTEEQHLSRQLEAKRRELVRAESAIAEHMAEQYPG